MMFVKQHNAVRGASLFSFQQLSTETNNRQGNCCSKAARLSKGFTAFGGGNKKNQVGAAKSGWQIYNVLIRFTVHIIETEEINLGYINLMVPTKGHIKICIADVVKRLGLHKSSFPVVVSAPDMAIFHYKH